MNILENSLKNHFKGNRTTFTAYYQFEKNEDSVKITSQETTSWTKHNWKCRNGKTHTWRAEFWHKYVENSLSKGNLLAEEIAWR